MIVFSGPKSFRDIRETGARIASSLTHRPPLKKRPRGTWKCCIVVNADWKTASINAAAKMAGQPNDWSILGQLRLKVTPSPWRAFLQI